MVVWKAFCRRPKFRKISKSLFAKFRKIESHKEYQKEYQWEKSYGKLRGLGTLFEQTFLPWL
jgi:hypothetical protein